MFRLLTYILLWILVDDGKRIKRAMTILFDDEVPEAEPKVVVAERKEMVTKPVNSKRDEIMDAINYLKSKKSKTKEDRNKIHMLEVILKSV